MFRPNADNLHDELHNALQSLPEKKSAKYVPIRKFLNYYLVVEMKKSGQIYYIDLGSCGFRIVHGAYQTLKSYV